MRCLALAVCLITACFATGCSFDTAGSSQSPIDTDNGDPATPPVDDPGAPPLPDSGEPATGGPDAGVPAEGCDAVCPGVCDGDVCVIDCGDDECDTLTCPAGYPCRVTCRGNNSCGGVNCVDSTSCEVACTGVLSCDSVLCGEGPCLIQCQGNNSCRGRLDCVNSCACDVQCTGENACDTEPSCPSECALDDDGIGCRSTGDDCNSCDQSFRY